MVSSFARSFILLTFSFLLSIFLVVPLQAHWGVKEAANVECLDKTMNYTVNTDGTWTCVTDITVKILTEAGRQSLSTQTFIYDATRNKTEILSASTQNQGTIYTVPKNRIENKPLASDTLGLTQKRQILIPFERVTVGSILHLKVREHFVKPDFPRYFSTFIGFQNGYIWNKVNINIDSQLPLLKEINDPRESLAIRENHTGSKYNIHITLKKPIYEQLIGEPDHYYGEAALFTSVFISTEKDFKRLGKLEAAFYQPTLVAPLPKELQKIRDEASRIEDEVACIDTIVAHLIGRITYLGNWNIAEGHLTPRSLEAIIASGSGDCKEYASCLTAILNNLGRGYTAKIALVERGDVYLEPHKKAVYNRSFNHAIVKVIGPSGKTYWVDPTNNVSMAGGIFPDIADRPSLVLDPENPTLERVPAIDYRHAVLQDERSFTFTKEGFVKTEGAFYFEGEAAKYLTEGLKMYHPSMVKEFVVKQICGCPDPLDPTVTVPAFTSPIVKSLRTTFSYGENNIMTLTNFGNAFPLLSHWYEPYISTSQTHEGALYVGHPQTLIKKRLFKNVSANGLAKLAFAIQTPWLTAKRELFQTQDGVVVIETVEKLKSIISAKELKSKEFCQLKKVLCDHCDGVSIVFSPHN